MYRMVVCGPCSLVFLPSLSTFHVCSSNTKEMESLFIRSSGDGPTMVSCSFVFHFDYIYGEGLREDYIFSEV